MIRRTDKVNAESDVLQLAVDLLVSCLAEYEISVNSMQVFGKAGITKLFQLGARRNSHTQKVMFRDLFWVFGDPRYY